MSLTEAVLEVAGFMEEDERKEGNVRFGYYARALRLAVKASQGATIQEVRCLPDDFEKAEVLRAKQRLNAQVQDMAKLDEASRQVVDGTGAICVGGKEHGTIAPVDPKMPVGAYVPLGDEVYQYREGKLYYHEDMTMKMREKTKQTIIT